MSKIDDLIKELCPEGVEFRQLGEICDLSNVGVDKKIREEERKIRLLNFVDVFKNQYINNQTPSMIVSASDKKIDDCSVQKDDIFITPSSEIIDEIGFSALATEDLIDTVYSYHVMRVRIKNKRDIFPKFLNYMFQASETRKQIRIKAQGITRYGLTQPKWLSIKIPIPPLEVQKEIVRVLDSFTELEAELEARKRQYEYYRNDLLTSDESSNAVEQKLLGEVVRIKNGKDWKVAGEGNIPVYGSGGRMSMRIDRCMYNKPTVLLPRKGTISNVFYVEEPFWNVDTVYYTEIDADVIIPKYFFYFMDNFNLSKLDTGSGRPSLTHAVLNKIRIPIPPMSRQKQIVSILDKFEKLTNDISIGLPAEIEARRKQYEYYRNKLLTFKELECAK